MNFTEIWNDYHSCVLQYNTQSNVWSSFCRLKIRRPYIASAIIEGKLVITGGMDCTFQIHGLKRPSLDTTEVVDLSTKTSRIAGNLNTPRQNHGMSIMKIDNKFKLVAFGGESVEGDGLLDSVEVWNSQTEKWKESHILKLDYKASRFTTLTVFNGPKLTDFTNQASKIPHKDSDEDKFTDMNPRLIHAHTLAPFNILLLTCTIFRLFPENLWMLLKFLACFEMLIQNLYNKLCMKYPYINSSLRYPTIILPCYPS